MSQQKTSEQYAGIHAWMPAIPAIWPLAESRRQGWHMLLVEDEASDVALAATMLDKSMPDYAWQILDRPSLSAAIGMLQRVKFDMALVDLSLQDVAGVETVSILRAAAPELPIVVYSGSSNMDLLNEAITAGAQFCIEKGLTDAKLVRAMIQCAMDSGLAH
ncbi:MAG: response regulator [Alphaproteobacteria bacterium]|nr:response regulator [Alphaproteobacteria bacterium]